MTCCRAKKEEISIEFLVGGLQDAIGPSFSRLHGLKAKSSSGDQRWDAGGY